MSLDKTFLEKDTPAVGICDIVKYKEVGEVLELGCGNSRNLAYLANNGSYRKFTGIDLDQEALISSNKRLSSLGIDFTLEKINLLEFNSQSKFEVILNSFSLPYFSRDEIAQIVMKNKEMTKQSGVNFYSYYSDKRVDLQKSNINSIIQINLLRQFYSDWEIVEFKKYKNKSNFDCEYVIFKKK